MNYLSDRGLHDLEDERWNLYGQLNFMGILKPPFSALYSNVGGSKSSLNNELEGAYAAAFTLYFGLKLWPGAGFYFAPEVVSLRPLSRLTGLSGTIPLFELQKGGSLTPALYRSRLFLRQVINFGAKGVLFESNPLQLGERVSPRRLILTFGNFSVVDVFDHNDVVGDLRQTFFNMAFMSHSAFDFAADARGYTLGATAEFQWDAWAVRAGQFAMPKIPNDLSLELRFWERYASVIELEHSHTILGMPGTVRLLGYRNQTFSGRFDDAIDAFRANPAKNAAACPEGQGTGGSTNATAPDLCWVRKTNVKLGIGLNLEQYVATDIGLFLRGMYSDGFSEVAAYNAADMSLSFGATARGTLWARPFDMTGIAVGLSWISQAHARYLAAGGVDGFIGDGRLNPGTEGVFEVFYSVNFVRAIWVSLDYQLIFNPGYNKDRAGPVHIPGLRVHAEF